MTTFTINPLAKDFVPAFNSAADMDNFHSQKTTEKKSVKYLTCWYWYTKGKCSKSDWNCLYSHYDTGKHAEKPRSVQPGGPALAGRNLAQKLSQGQKEQRHDAGLSDTERTVPGGLRSLPSVPDVPDDQVIAAQASMTGTSAVPLSGFVTSSFVAAPGRPSLPAIHISRVENPGNTVDKLYKPHGKLFGRIDPSTRNKLRLDTTLAPPIALESPQSLISPGMPSTLARLTAVSSPLDSDEQTPTRGAFPVFTPTGQTVFHGIEAQIYLAKNPGLSFSTRSGVPAEHLPFVCSQEPLVLPKHSYHNDTINSYSTNSWSIRKVTMTENRGTKSSPSSIERRLVVGEGRPATSSPPKPASVAAQRPAAEQYKQDQAKLLEKLTRLRVLVGEVTTDNDNMAKARKIVNELCGDFQELRVTTTDAIDEAKGSTQRLRSDDQQRAVSRFGLSNCEPVCM